MDRIKKSELQINKIITELRKNEYIRAAELAVKCHLSAATIYRLIKTIRKQGIGIYGSRRGFVLSEFATQRDDVEFIRRCMGRRSGDIMAIEAAKKDILPRWKGIKNGRNNLTPLLGHLTAHSKKEEEQAATGMQFLLSYVNDKGL